MTPISGDGLVATLGDQFVDELRGVLGGADTCALLDYPHHPNVGDNAIWLGERAALRRLGVRVRYVCTIATWDPDVLRRNHPEGPVLLHGGGNFGDIWPSFQHFRERAAETLVDRQLVVLPQTVHFDDPAAAQRTQATLGAHPSLTVLARDRDSLETLVGLGIESRLSPDAAFALAPIPRPMAASTAVVWLLRTDTERPPDRGSAPATVVDWIDPADPGNRAAPWTVGRARVAAATRVDRALHRRGRASNLTAGAVDQVSREHLSRGLTMLSAGSVVVTDRLHGHILCLLLAIPHVVLDNRYGKLGRFLDSWTGSSPLVRRASSLEEASALAQELLIQQ